MARTAAVVALLVATGCNAVFGLDPVTAPDAGGDGDASRDADPDDRDGDADDHTDAPPGADTDGDGVLNRVETALGWNPALRDSDGDGLEDLLEDRNLNGVVDSGETGVWTTDSDGDGARDGDEDANHNGRQDYGEGAPTVADTDGDGASDGAEAVAGTHPFLDTDVLRCLSLESGPGAPLLRWPTKAGRQYRVLRGTSPTAWSNAPTGAGADQQSLHTATTNGSATYCDPAPPSHTGFYRIGVQ